jgi:hypothetical protein
MGGGTDTTDAFLAQIQWSGGGASLASRLRGGHARTFDAAGDFLVLRVDDDALYNDWVFSTLGASLLTRTHSAGPHPCARRQAA